jgi:group II intron reverse transcriptase/maturase/CRISPR-associated endonuclease Cas1
MGEYFEQVCSEPVLFDAWRRVQRKGSRGGIDHMTIATFAERLNDHLAALAEDLRSCRYVPEPFQKIGIPKADDPGEFRPLQMPTVRDKIAQEAVRSVIAPVFEKTFVDCNYAYRPKKGPQKAIRRVEHYLAAKHTHVALADIDRFFDTMDQALTLQEVSKHMAEPEMLRLLELWMKMGAVNPRGDWVDPVSGVAQGSVISPLLSNIYLTPFDAYLTQKGYALVRYADNFILLARGAEAAGQALDDARDFLQQRLKLKLNHHPRPVTSCAQGFVFLGIYFRGSLRRIANGKIAQMKAEIRQLWHRRGLEQLPRLLSKLNESIEGWRRYYGMVNPGEQFAELDRYIAEGLARALEQRFDGNKLPTKADLYGMIESLQFLQVTAPESRKKALWSIVQRTRELRQAVQAPAEKAAPAASAAPSKADATPKAAPSVGQAVRQQKRRYMRQAVQTSELVITEPGVFLGKTSRRVVVKKQRRVIMEMPLKQLRHIVITTPAITLSSAVIALCAKNQIPLDFLTPRGDPLARLSTPLDALGTTGLQQLQALQDGRGMQLAKIIVRGKLRNQLNLVKYYHKYRKRVDAEFADAFDEVEQKFETLFATLKTYKPEGDYDTVRHRLFAFEGQGGNLYWQMIRLLLEDDIAFPGRERRGATDLVNSLLNYGYGMLYPRVQHALVLAGLHPGVSFLHSMQDNKPTLVYDLIEEFRAQAVDRVVFGMITKGEPLALDTKTGRLTKATIQKLVQNVLERWATPVRYRQQEKPLQEVIGLQAKRLAAHVAGEGSYRPFIGRW